MALEVMLSSADTALQQGIGRRSDLGTPHLGKEDPSLLAFLADPRSYPDRPPRVETIETHMSRVFLAGDRAYKLKKPIRLSFVDFTTLEARRQSCERELALNRQLAPDIYLEVIPIGRRADGTLALRGERPTVEWLLVMRRLSADRLLHNAISRREVGPEDIHRVCDALGRKTDMLHRPRFRLSRKKTRLFLPR